MSERIAVVDVGTNSTRLLVAEVQEGRIVRELQRVSRVTRLGAGVDSSGRLAQDALEREHAVLADYRKLIAGESVQRQVAVMTSAVRDAANGGDFAAEVAYRYGLAVKILTGDEEARLTYLGATDELDRGDHRTVLVLDIGGGSTEMVIGQDGEISFHVSTQAGVVRQADRHITADPPSEDELAAVAHDVRETISAAVPEEHRRGIGLAVAVAGTPTALAAIAQRLEPYDPSRVHGYTLTAQVRDEIRAQLANMPLAERQHVPGLHPDRANVIIPGIVILTEVMDLFGLQSVQVSEHDILRGAAIAYSPAAR